MPMMMVDAEFLMFEFFFCVCVLLSVVGCSRLQVLDVDEDKM